MTTGNLVFTEIGQICIFYDILPAQLRGNVSYLERAWRGLFSDVLRMAPYCEILVNRYDIYILSPQHASRGLLLRGVPNLVCNKRSCHIWNIDVFSSLNESLRDVLERLIM